MLFGDTVLNQGISLHTQDATHRQHRAGYITSRLFAIMRLDILQIKIYPMKTLVMFFLSSSYNCLYLIFTLRNKGADHNIYSQNLFAMFVLQQSYNDFYLSVHTGMLACAQISQITCLYCNSLFHYQSIISCDWQVSKPTLTVLVSPF